jgi:hypothetical protein
MSLEQASDFAQVVGAVAVVISLVYVGFQLHLNTTQLRRGEANATLMQASAFRLAVAGNGEVARLLDRGLTNDQVLDAPDRMRFEMLLSEFTWITFHMWERFRLRIGTRGQWQRGPLPALARYLSTPGGKAWWEVAKVRFPPDFSATVDGALTASNR